MVRVGIEISQSSKSAMVKAPKLITKRLSLSTMNQSGEGYSATLPQAYPIVTAELSTLISEIFLNIMNDEGENEVVHKYLGILHVAIIFNF